MTPRYTIKSYLWIPRVKDVLAGSQDNTYFAAAAGLSWKFFSDTPELPKIMPGVQPGTVTLNWELPSWLPRKLFIVRTKCVFSAVSTGAVNLFAWVDPEGISYNSTNPRGVELNSDLTRQRHLLTWNNAGIGGQHMETYPYPILLDRDAGDKLVAELSASVLVGSWGFVFDYLVPNNFPCEG